MKKAIIGYGGHAREVMAQMGKKLICFVDDQFVCKNTKPLSEFDEKKFKVIVAIGDSKKRHDIVQKLPNCLVIPFCVQVSDSVWCFLFWITHLSFSRMRTKNDLQVGQKEEILMPIKTSISEI